MGSLRFRAFYLLCGFAAEALQVAFWAHVGGFVGGMVLIFLFRNRRLLDRHPYHGFSQRSSRTRRWHRVDSRRGRP